MSSVGRSVEEIDQEAPDENAVADALGFDVDDDQEASDDLPSRAEMWEVIQSQQKEIEQLSCRVDELEDAQEDADEKRKEMAASFNEARENAEEAREIAVAANAEASKAKEIAGDDDAGDEGEDRSLPGDVEPSTSPLDFFCNVRQHKAKQHFVDEKGEKNTYRALLVARRWDEFATVRTDGAVHFERDDVREALTAILGKSPHGTTITRVWEQLRDELGGADLLEKERQVSKKQEKKKLLIMPVDVAEGLNENRYAHLDLLGDASGVTPVVTDGEA